MPERVFTSHEVAGLLQVSPSAVLSWVNSGLLPAFRTPGGHRRIRSGELLAFLQSHRMPVPPPLLPPHRLLAIDDEPEFLRAVRRILARAAPGIAVETAAGPIDGLLKVGTFRPDLVLLDGYMPGMDGVEVCAHLQADPATRQIAVIAITGHPSGELEARFRAAGAVGFLSKPLEIGTFLAVLHTRGLIQEFRP
jgi:excisionase family DNA binding protein